MAHNFKKQGPDTILAFTTLDDRAKSRLQLVAEVIGEDGELYNVTEDDLGVVLSHGRTRRGARRVRGSGDSAR